MLLEVLRSFHFFDKLNGTQPHTLGMHAATRCVIRVLHDAACRTLELAPSRLLLCIGPKGGAAEGYAHARWCFCSPPFLSNTGKLYAGAAVLTEQPTCLMMHSLVYCSALDLLEMLLQVSSPFRQFRPQCGSASCRCEKSQAEQIPQCMLSVLQYAQWEMHWITCSQGCHCETSKQCHLEKACCKRLMSLFQC